MKHCYNCGILLTDDNASEEHIIPNACGGRLTSKKLLCKSCNSKFGNSYDAELLKELKLFSVLLNVRRDRGTHQPVVRSDGCIALPAKGKPYLLKPIEIYGEENGRKTVRIQADNPKQIRNILGKMRHEGKINLSDAEIEDYIANLTITEEPSPPLPINGTIGQGNSNRAIAKIALNFYAMHHDNIIGLDDVLAFVNGNNNRSLSNIYYPSTPPLSISNDIVSHIIYLAGNPNTKLLYCYIELFNVQCYLVVLSEKYSGPQFRKVYEYDLISGKEISETRNDVFDLTHESMALKPSGDNFHMRFNRFMGIHMDLKKLLPLIDQAIDEFTKSFPNEIEIIKKQRSQIFSELRKKLRNTSAQ